VGYDGNVGPLVSSKENGLARGEDVVLTAADGNQFFAFVAYPSNPTGVQIIVYPDVRGLHSFYKGLALRFAESGIVGVAIDYFGRTAGLTGRDDAFDFKPHVQQLTAKNVYIDARAALDFLKTHVGTVCGAAFTVGFSTGGSLSLYTGLEDMGLAGVIVFYPVLSRTIDNEKGTVLASADIIKVPVLGFFGTDDVLVPNDDVQQLDEQLDKTGVQHSIITYPGAPHNFFDHKATEFAEESADAWRRTLDFITKQS
jgi:carboxymethylenebutenolidase